jgi:hypothetical protein
MFKKVHVFFVVALSILVVSPSFAQRQPAVGVWKTWALTSAQEFRLPAPPDSAATRSEIQQLETLAKQRDAAALQLVRYWDAGAPADRWNELAVQHALKNGVGRPRAARAFALLNVAMYDATITAWDAKYAYWQIRPFQLEPTLTTVFAMPNHPVA